MEGILIIEDQLGHIVGGGTWHGESLSELLSNVGAQAAARHLPTAQSIKSVTRIGPLHKEQSGSFPLFLPSLWFALQN